MSKAPDFKFKSHPSVSTFLVSSQNFFSQNPDDLSRYQHLATGAVVFDKSTPPRILLIQRAANDSMPNLWETPGGACDDDDETLLYGVARELWEEAGLKATSIGPQVGEGYVFHTRSGKTVSKFTFIAEVESEEVKLDPEEHQKHVWATEEEVKRHRVGDVVIDFTHSNQEDVVLQAFEVQRGTRA